MFLLLFSPFPHSRHFFLSLNPIPTTHVLRCRYPHLTRLLMHSPVPASPPPPSLSLSLSTPKKARASSNTVSRASFPLGQGKNQSTRLVKSPSFSPPDVCSPSSVSTFKIIALCVAGFAIVFLFFF